MSIILGVIEQLRTEEQVQRVAFHWDMKIYLLIFVCLIILHNNNIKDTKFDAKKQVLCDLRVLF